MPAQTVLRARAGGCLIRAAWRFAIACAPVLLAVGGFAASDKFLPEQTDFYDKQVLPILADNCYPCHSHQADKIKGGFLLDSRPALLKGGETGPAIVPGNAEKSLLIKAVRRVDEDLQMPPKKKLTEAQVGTLARWIDMGAPFSEATAAINLRSKGKKITEEDRQWWSFRPIRPVAVPQTKDEGWARNPIDNFIYEKLAGKGLKPAGPADPRALIRRVYFDVIGLPPTFEEIEHFAADPSPRAYESMVENVLANPRYGEKWARHWLDLVRYAESDGYKADGFRPTAWRYRDYVIRSFNQDKPYDRFVMEQLAADELWPEDPDALIGVSYLRLWIYEYNQRNIRAHWATILNDVTDVTGDAFMGLGIQCARCHDHKFDPILQRDYYRLQAFFAGLAPRDDLPLATPGELRRYRDQLAQWEKVTAPIRNQVEEMEQPAREKIVKAVIDKLPKDIQAIMYKPAAERTPYEQQLRDLAYRQVADEGEKLDSKFKGAEKVKLEALRAELAGYDHLKPAHLTEAMLVTDIGKVAPPVVIPRDKSQTPIEPGFLSVLAPEPARIESLSAESASTGRRATLAKWLVHRENPLTSRVLVNRLWQHHFGRGLVGTPSDFGHLGDQPTHPELLDWLAKYFIDHQWSVKSVQRLILTSATYRQSALVPEPVATAAAGVDPDNRLLWRQNIRRLESDQIRDALLAASGELDLVAGGPSVDASKPRRTVYVKWLRNSRDPLLDAFDPPDTYTSAPQRNVTTTPIQSMVMINGSYVYRRATALANRLQSLRLNDPSAVAAAAYRIVYGRQPTRTEQDRAVSFLAQQTLHAKPADPNLEVPQPPRVDADTAALVDFCHVLLNSNEFLYVD